MVEQTDEEFIAAVKRAAWKEHFYHASATVLRLSAIIERLEKERDEVEAERGAIAKRHEYALIEGSARLAERNAALAENARLREHIADLNNTVRHEFSAAVEAAADKLFSAIGATARSALTSKE